MRNFIKILESIINTDNDDQQQIDFKNKIKKNNIYIELTKKSKQKQIIETKITTIIEKEKEEDEFDFLAGLGEQDVIKTETKEIEI
jgi:hypothetical protein